MERDLDYSEDVYEAEDDETFSELVLSKFDGNEPIYLGTDDDGGLKFRQNLFSYWTSKSKTYLSEMAVVALGLTETCCRIRQGKVLMVAMLDKLPRSKFRWNKAPDACEKVVRAFYRMPKLIYIPYRWSKKEQADWMAMSHSSRFQTLNARAGALMYKDPAMPINLVYDPVNRKTFQLDAFVDEHSGCKASLAIVPRAYVGWSWQFHQKADKTKIGADTMDNPAGAWHVVREDNVADLYVKDAEEVVRKLDTMYYARVPGSLIWMKSLFSGLIEFNRQLVTMEKGSKAGR